MRKTDKTLLESFHDGDSGALEELLERHHRDVHHFLGLCVGDDALARDLLVEFYAEAYLAGRRPETRFDPARGPVKGYLLALAGKVAHEMLTAGMDLSHHRG